jgi:predicted metal-dependent enzyme (double-stranded beta helix superfamily)
MVRRAIPLVVLLLCPGFALAQDPIKLDPAHHKVEFENAHVRVLRISFGPGEKAPMHQHPPGVAVFLSDEAATVLPQGGSPNPNPAPKRGGVVLADASTHTVEHKGKTRSELILVEFKAPAPARTLNPDAVKADPKHYTVEAENDRFRVIRIRYGPGEKSVLHQHYPGVAIALSDAASRFTDAGGKSVDEPMKAGQVTWDPGDAHVPENTGTQPFEVVLVEIKPAR